MQGHSMNAITGVPDGGYSSFAVMAQGRGSARSATGLSPLPGSLGRWVCVLLPVTAIA